MVARWTLALVLVASAFAAAPGAHAQGQVCSKQLLAIDAAPVTVELCVPPADPTPDASVVRLPVTESLSTKT
ncbi:MAG TPA: hypothetical protein VGD50_07100, partial [Candidatus Baltobacteraceae bacterium]